MMLKEKVQKFPSKTVSVSTTKPTGGKFTKNFIFIVSFRCRLCIKAYELSRHWNLLFGTRIMF